MNELVIRGEKDFMGVKIKIVEGGFGENQRVLTDRMIAEIHGMENRHVRERINLNIKRFKENVDFIDLKQRVGEFPTLDLTEFGYAKQSITQAEHIYLLSERGYSKLIKIMDTDLAWEVMDKMNDEYFTMREIINSDEQLMAKLCLDLYKGGQGAILAGQEMTRIEVEKAVIPLIATIEEQKPMVIFANHVAESTNTIDMGELSKLANKEDIDIGRTRLFTFLKENKVLMSNGIPYQKYIDNKWLTVIETVKENQFGSKVFTKVLATGKGQIGIINLLRESYVA